MPATVCARAKPNKERVKRDRAVNQTACPKVRAGFPWGSWKEHAEHYETTRLRGKAHEVLASVNGGAVQQLLEPPNVRARHVLRAEGELGKLEPCEHIGGWLKSGPFATESLRQSEGGDGERA